MLKKLMIYEALNQAKEKRLKTAQQIKTNVCRLCMASNVKMVGIFDCLNRNLAKDIQFCTGILIQKTDDLPKKMCNGCLAQLKTAYIFKSKCLRTEKKLNNLSSCVKTELNRIPVKNEVGKQEKVLKKQDRPKTLLPTVQRQENSVNFLEPKVKQEKSVTFLSLKENATIPLPNVQKENKVENKETAKNSVPIIVQKEKVFFLQTQVKQEKPTIFLSPKEKEKATNSLITVPRTENKVLFIHSQEKQKELVNLPGKQEKAISLLQKQEISSSAKETLENQLITIKIETEQDEGRIEISEEMNENEDIFEDWTSTQVESEASLEDILNPSDDQTRYCDFILDKRRRKVVDSTKRNDKCLCEICGKQLANSLTLRGHMNSHQPPSMFCAHCDYKTNNRSDLCKHIKLHTEEKHYQCGYCAKMFHLSSNLYVHIRRMHENSVKKYKCTICDSKYTTNNGLKRHYASHLNERKFECEVCLSRFNIRRHWKRHLKNLHNITLPRLKRGRRRNMDIDTTCEDLSTKEAPLSIFLTKNK